MQDYSKLHKEIANNVGLEERDIVFFRGHHFHGKTKRDIIDKLTNRERLYNLKKYNPERYQRYLSRLSFMTKMTQDQWLEITKKAENSDKISYKTAWTELIRKKYYVKSVLGYQREIYRVVGSITHYSDGTKEYVDEHNNEITKEQMEKLKAENSD